MQNISEEISTDNSFNIIEILRIDHAYLKECIAVLLSDEADAHEKIFYARTFLDTLKNHTTAEEKTVYDSLVDMDEMHLKILEAEVEHAILKFKYDELIPRVATQKILDDVTEAELKVLARIVFTHILDEEMNLFPKMYQNLDRGILNEIGFQFMILRKFTPQDLKDYPELQKNMYQNNLTNSPNTRKHIYEWSGEFVKKVNRYISSLISNPRYLKN